MIFCNANLALNASNSIGPGIDSGDGVFDGKRRYARVEGFESARSGLALSHVDALARSSLLCGFAMAFSLAQTTTIRSTITLSLCFSTSTSSAASSFLSTAKLRQPNKWISQVASSLELGGVKVAKEDVVRDDDPTNKSPTQYLKTRNAVA